jgi:hypothetical protein
VSKRGARSRRTSTGSGGSASGSKLRWKQPRTVKQFASQAAAVGTLLLNGKLDIEVAKSYSAIARTVAQAVTADVNRARFVRAAPDLTFDQDVFEE